MSAAIKKMLAERAARERPLAAPTWFNDGVRLIKEAAPKLDAGFNSTTKWKPSEVLLLGFCVLATSERPDGAKDLLRALDAA
jgi:hypothetical protein